MGPDEARLQDVQSWLSKAELWGYFRLHSQQAGEEAMKAFLAWHDKPFRKTHNLEELGRQCVALDATLRAIADQAAPLTEYAWKFRYPGEPDEPECEEAARSTGGRPECLCRHPNPSAANGSTVKPKMDGDNAAGQPGVIY